MFSTYTISDTTSVRICDAWDGKALRLEYVNNDSTAAAHILKNDVRKLVCDFQDIGCIATDEAFAQPGLNMGRITTLALESHVRSIVKRFDSISSTLNGEDASVTLNMSGGDAIAIGYMLIEAVDGPAPQFDVDVFDVDVYFDDEYLETLTV